MKTAISHTVTAVFTNFRKRKISKKNKNLSRIFILILILFLMSIQSIHSNINTFNTKVQISTKPHIKFNGIDSLELAKSNSELDTDKDGVIDILDLDDDNDGILDNDEGFTNLHSLKNKGLIITMNGSWVLVHTSVYLELPSTLSHGDEFWVPFMGSQYVKAVKIKFENTQDGIRFTQTASKHTVGNDPELDSNLDYDFDNGGIIAPIANSDTDEGYGIASIEYNDKVIISEYLAETGRVWLSPELDTDNDGFINSRDTDSDNDGCPDASEGNNNIITTATLNNGSNGGSMDNLGVSSNNKGIPLPLGTLNGEETEGQNNSDTSITSEQLVVSPIADISVNAGENVNIIVSATAMRTATFNLGVPNYSTTYATDVSDLIEYKWYREDNVNTIVSTSKSLILDNIEISSSGNYIVEINGSGNACIIKEHFALKVDNILGVIDNFNKTGIKYQAYPNPTQGNLNVSLSSIVTTEVKIVLFDISGKEIYSKIKSITEGKNDFGLMINVKPGIFFLKVFNSEVDYGISKIVFK